jgi:uncharacterized membrane protein
MGTLRGLIEDTATTVLPNRDWMTWNLTLAAVPAILAVLLFHRDRRRGPLWWVGAATFILFLPNAPYVLTDLIHLRGDVTDAPHDVAVLAGVLPQYAMFIAAGFGCYAIALAELGGWLRRRGLHQHVGKTEIGLHLLSATGIVLGRLARLNSWDTFTSPDATVERSLATLSWRGAPLAIAVLFVAVWLSHATVRAVGRAALVWLRGAYVRASAR